MILNRHIPGSIVDRRNVFIIPIGKKLPDRNPDRRVTMNVDLVLALLSSPAAIHQVSNQLTRTLAG